MQFNEKLQKLRKETGMSQEQLAEKLHVSRQAISKWELGTSTPDTDNIVMISRCFQVPLEYLLMTDFDTVDEYNEELNKNIQSSGNKKPEIMIKTVILAAIGMLIICVAWLLTYQLQAWDMNMNGSAYTDALLYLKKCPLIIMLLVGVALIVFSIYLFLDDKKNKNTNSPTG